MPSFWEDQTVAKAATQKDYEKAQAIRDDRSKLNKSYENSFSRDPFKKGLGDSGLGVEKVPLSSNNSSFGGVSAPKIPVNNNFNSNNFNNNNGNWN